ncbi:MAG: hypothetical protein NZ901_04080 [Geminocystis sp.]|nr:hypothetical protein [Geminocystis sp.]HIK38561.1 hypothetical protein [Geminocystis sp. M7585_C2015_104]MCS7147350.1 hypothetical protein [Geminocystis sp.]MCX8079068.1 hypothetical protein [Geminocystis sp.]MDW8116349.1 hypothetical protein [Geminocystis sp.]
MKKHKATPSHHHGWARGGTPPPLYIKKRELVKGYGTFFGFPDGGKRENRGIIKP